MLYRFWPIALAALGLAGCATFTPKIAGQTDIVAWEATDLSLERRGPQNLWVYSFELLIGETRGVAVTFKEIETTIYQPGTMPWSGRFNGSWTLEARDQFRIPLYSSLGCGVSFDGCDGPNVPIPLWRIVMQGTDERGQAVKAVIDLSLPAAPPAVPVKTSRSVREITLVPAKR